MKPITLPIPLGIWARNQNLPAYEWRKPGVADYDSTSDTWLIDGVLALRFVVETDEERYYCGLYQGPLEPAPIMYWAVLEKAMLLPSLNDTGASSSSASPSA